MPTEPRKLLSCSFCGKSQREVRKLIAGPTVYICDECVQLCHDILTEEIDRENVKTGLCEICTTRPARCIGKHNGKKQIRACANCCGRPTGDNLCRPIGVRG